MLMPSVYLLRAESDAERTWIDEHISEDALRFGGGVAVEHRYIDDIVEGMLTDGLEPNTDFSVQR